MAGTDIADLACDIEIERLGEPVGKQDQYIAAVGGLTAFEFHADDRVDVISVPVPDGVRGHLEENLLLFYTGLRRSASAELSALDEGTKLGDDDLLQNLDEVKQAGRRTFATLCDGDLEAFAGQLTDQWSLKYRRSPSPIHQRVDAWIRLGLEAGALGGKLVGAGGGGFLLFYADAKVDLRGGDGRARLRGGRLQLRLPGLLRDHRLTCTRSSCSPAGWAPGSLPSRVA